MQANDPKTGKPFTFKILPPVRASCLGWSDVLFGAQRPHVGYSSSSHTHTRNRVGARRLSKTRPLPTSWNGRVILATGHPAPIPPPQLRRNLTRDLSTLTLPTVCSYDVVGVDHTALSQTELQARYELYVYTVCVRC